MRWLGLLGRMGVPGVARRKLREESEKKKREREGERKGRDMKVEK
jgi:hypothetical protein